MNNTDDILATNGTFAHPLSTLGAGNHVSTFQQDTVNGRVHTDPTDIVLQARSSFFRLYRSRRDNIRITDKRSL